MTIRRINRYGFSLALTVLLLLVFSGSVMAAGFAIIEQSAASAGYAYAGAGAAAEDASTIFFNPAGMAFLAGNELQLGVHYIVPQADFDNQGSTTALGTSLNGGNGGDGGDPAFVPNLFYMHDFSSKWKAGIGITAPYGLVTEYDDGWVGRYHGLRSELATLNINPSVSYAINAQWALGVGISIAHAEAELKNAIDYGTLLVSQGLAPPSASQNLDGKSEVVGDDWGIGANVGLIYSPLSGTRIGVHYRSSIDHTLEGDATFQTPTEATAVAQALGLVNTSVTADVTLPESVSISAYHAFNPRWAVVADVTWTKWSHLEELRIKFNSGANDAVDTLAWDDAWRYSLGGIFQPTNALALRAGVAFDESPIPDAKRRTPRIPGADRIWLTLGAGYQVSPLIRIDAAYGHLFIDDPKIDKDISDPENQLRGALVGEYDSSVDILSASVSFSF